MIGDNETPELQTQTGKPRKRRRGRLTKVKDADGMALDDCDFEVEAGSIGRDDFVLDGRRLGSLIGGE